MFREGVGIDEAPLLAMERAQEAAPETQTGLKARDHWRLIGVMVLLTVVDTVLCSLLLFYYSETYANYINSGTGLFYIIVSTMHRAYVDGGVDASDLGRCHPSFIKEFVIVR